MKAKCASTAPLIAALAEACKRHPISEKWLLAPSLRVGAQWVDQVAWSGQGVLNLRVKTLRGAALDLAQTELLAKKLTPLPDRGAVMMVERIFARLRPELKYLGGLEPGTRVAETIHRSIQSLRLAGVESGAVRTSCFEAVAKGEDMARLLAAFERRLNELHFADAAQILRLAMTRLGNEPGTLPPDLFVLVPEGLESSRLERALVQSLGKARIVKLQTMDPVRTDGKAPGSDIELLQRFHAPAGAPPPARDGRVQFVAAAGESNEVREVLRRAATGKIPLDQIELLHTDSGTYVPLVFETLLLLGAGNEKRNTLPPVTFAEGIPCRYSRPGRALQGWVAWVREDLPQSSLVKMIRDGLISTSHETGEDEDGEGSMGRGAFKLASSLRSLGIGFGRSRYLQALDQRIESLERRARGEALPPSGDEDLNEGRDSIEAVVERIETTRKLRDVVARLLNTIPDERPKPLEALLKAQDLLESLARSSGELDAYARQKLVEEIRDMARWIASEDDAISFDALDWLASLPDRTSILGSGPRPGCLHVAPAIAGGHSGRLHTFLVGLDDGRFPRGGLQDPLILDSEKKNLSSEIVTSADRLGRDAEELSRLLARLRGHVTFSFSTLSLTDDSELFPSPALLTLYRLISGHHDADASAFLGAVAAEMASFAPFEPERALDATECWLSLLCGADEIENREELLKARFPHLDRGRKAGQARLDPTRITEFDGFVPDAGRDLDPTAERASPISASKLETAGECPLKFFFKYGLRLEKPEDLEVDPDQWLDAPAQGRLLHLVFEEFVRGLISNGKVPDRARDREALLEILQRRVEEFRGRHPPPGEAAFERQRRDLKRIVEKFLIEDDDYVRQRNARPVHLEASLGMKPEGHATEIDSPDPIDFHLEDGRRIRVRGRIDRVDRVGDPSSQSYAIWDYKTGRATKFNEEKSDPEGRVLQPALYVSMVEQRLRKVVSSRAQVASFGFLFPGVQAEGERIEWSPADLPAQRARIGILCDLLGSGKFLPTIDEKRCRYCDYREICGDVAEITRASKDKHTQADCKPSKPAIGSKDNDE